MEQLHVEWMDEPGPPTCCASRWTSCAPGTAGRADAAGDARRHRDLPAGRAGAGAERRALRRRTRCCCSPRTASCTCSASTTPSRRKRKRCSGSSASCSDGFTGQGRPRRDDASDPDSILAGMALAFLSCRRRCSPPPRPRSPTCPGTTPRQCAALTAAAPPAAHPGPAGGAHARAALLAGLVRDGRRRGRRRAAATSLLGNVWLAGLLATGIMAAASASCWSGCPRAARPRCTPAPWSAAPPR